MDENVLAGRTLDESISLGAIEPLHCTFLFHKLLLSPLVLILFPRGQRPQPRNPLAPGERKLLLYTPRERLHKTEWATAPYWKHHPARSRSPSLLRPSRSTAKYKNINPIPCLSQGKQAR